MIYLMVSVLLIGAAVGAKFRIRVLVAIISLWLLTILFLFLFISTSGVMYWTIAAVVFQCGYFLGMIIRTVLDSTGFTMSRLASCCRSEYGSASEKDCL